MTCLVIVRVSCNSILLEPLEQSAGCCSVTAVSNSLQGSDWTAGVHMAESKKLTGFAGPQHLPECPLKPSAAIHRPQILPKMLHQHRLQLDLTRPPVPGSKCFSLIS